MTERSRSPSCLRACAVDLDSRRLLVANYARTEQEADLSLPTNTGGFGRIHRFRRHQPEAWPENPLPIDPACAALGLGKVDEISAQVYQLAICNWSCWYCFVPRCLLTGANEHTGWLTVAELLNGYEALTLRPPIIDLSGGQPDLVPEWTPWTMRELVARRLESSVYLWSDDNLSTDFLWRFVPQQDLDLMLSFENYGRVGCFKGFDEESFVFNSGANSAGFALQFELMKRLVQSGMDVYAYVTLTTPNTRGIGDRMKAFVDRLEAISPSLPLRTTPLQIREWAPVGERLTTTRREALHHNQHVAVQAWQEELRNRGLGPADVLGRRRLPSAD